MASVVEVVWMEQSEKFHSCFNVHEGICDLERKILQSKQLT